ncbi:MAG: tetratricopeptide repeat protein [Bacteroidia bacterium]|nr:tetratricopeptide repeat protein [Bacteroidia bacterium]NNC84789.1 tetratricopeptide repeat protein [Bacteroidia bacterium]NNM16669.1 tetratricopeptide repeat protein [Bacteroidia bacterium]
MKLIYTIFFVGLSISCTAQNFQKEFKKHYSANDTTAQFNVLIEWEKQNPDDAELYTSYFNYYFNLATKEIMAIEDEPSSNESLEIVDSLGNVKGYINNKIVYTDEYINKGFEYINIGIKKYPSRLDMRFGKAHVYSKMDYWEDFTRTIINTIDYSEQNNVKWTWTNNEPLEEPAEFLLASVQDYCVMLYNNNDDKSIVLMQKIALKVLEYHPDNTKSLSNLSISYMLTGEIDKALKALLKAEKIEPTDYIVLSNIAHAYKLKGDIDSSISYYEKTHKYGDEQAKQFATEQINLLKQNK